MGTVLTTRIGIAAVVVLASLTGATVASAAGARPVQRTSRDSLQLRKQVQDDIARFLRQWRSAWLLSASRKDVAPVYVEVAAARRTYTHCHVVGDGGEEGEWRMRAGYDGITTPPNAFAKCPTWLIGEPPSGGDEADGIDNALAPEQRVIVRAARDTLLGVLDRARAQLPGDAWLVGQLVRFRVDQHDWDAAFNAVDTCVVDAFWCAALRGYVYARAGRPEADAHFVAATAAIPRAARCDWLDISPLIAQPERAQYLAQSCAAREQLFATFWWLADRSWRDAVNERRAEHFARRVLILLRSALPDDEKQLWYPLEVRSTLTEWLIRYGWPTTGVWGGGAVDVGHDNYLRLRQTESVAPYTTAEYSPYRLHLSAAYSAVLDPYHATASAWQLNAPPGAGYNVVSQDRMWWPHEHARYGTAPLYQLASGQSAVLRRQQDVRLLLAIDGGAQSDNSADILGLMSDSSRATLITSEGADEPVAVYEQPATRLARVVIDRPLTSRPMLLDVELAAVGARAPRGTARLRQGLTPPPPLRELAPNTIDISDPIFFEAGEPGALPSDADAVSPLMLGSLDVSPESRLGVFWETYGVAVGDSIQFTVTVTPTGRPGLLRRVGSALRVVSSAMNGVAVTWTDPRLRDGATATSAVPILPRAIIVSLAGLPRGGYQVEITATSKGRPAVRSQRDVMIR